MKILSISGQQLRSLCVEFWPFCSSYSFSDFCYSVCTKLLAAFCEGKSLLDTTYVRAGFMPVKAAGSFGYCASFLANAANPLKEPQAAMVFKMACSLSKDNLKSGSGKSCGIPCTSFLLAQVGSLINMTYQAICTGEECLMEIATSFPQICLSVDACHPLCPHWL